MPIDQDATFEAAKRLLRLGLLDGAAADDVRPAGGWYSGDSLNLVADGNPRDAIEQHQGGDTVDACAVDESPCDVTDSAASHRESLFDVPPADDARDRPVEDIEALYQALQEKAGGLRAVSGLERYHRALRHLRDDRVGEAVLDLRLAADTPLWRFKAAARLGRLYLTRGEFGAGIHWLERAAAAPAPSPGERSAVLDDLADAVERFARVQAGSRDA